MYLKSLTLKGFKSFADRSVLSLEPGITAIVGPNGSGKSNISDAVLWVLGERNARHLRGQSMEDVIFSGSSKRKPVSVAEVELVLDNSDHTLPVDYDEVAIARRMYRTGESEYLINGSLVRRNDVLDVLHDTGLGTGTHSIISQGSLDSILQSRPEDRRALIEEAAGILKHKQRKEKSARKLEKMDANLARVQDVAGEISRQLGPLARKAKRARAFQEASTELASLRLALAVDDLRGLQRAWGEACESEKLLSESVESARGTAQAAERKVNELSQIIARESADAGHLARNLRRASSAAERLDSAALLLSEKRRAAQSYEADIQVALEGASQRVSQAQMQLAEAADQAKQADRSFENAQAKVRDIDQQRYDAASARREKERAVSDAEKLQRELERKREDARRRSDAAKEGLSSGIARQRLMEARRAEVADTLLEARKASQQAQDLEKEAESVVSQADEAQKAAAKRLSDAFSKRADARAAHDAARDELAGLEGQLTALRQAQQARRREDPALSWAVDHAPQIAGEIAPLAASLGAVQGMESLVEQVLADDVDALIVNDAQGARALVEGLAHADVDGSVTLVLAHDATKGQGAKARSSAVGQPLVDLLRVAEGARRAAEALLGDVVVVDTASQAFAAHEADTLGLRFVSRDGCVVYPQGAARVLGRPADAQEGVLARQRRIEQLEGQVTVAQTRVDQSEAALEAENDAYRSAQEESLAASQALAEARGRASSVKADAQRAKRRLSQVADDAAAVERQYADAKKTVEELTPSVESIAAEIEALDRQRSEAASSIEQAREELEPLRQQAAKLSEKLNEAKLERATLSERKDYAHRMEASRRQALEREEHSLADSKEQLAVKRVAVRRAAPVLALLDELSRKLQERARVIEEAAAAQETSTAAMHAQASAARDDAKKARQAFDEANEHMAQAKVDKGRLEVQVDAAVKAIVDGCGTPLDVASKLPVLENRAQAEAESDRLARRIKGMGAINPDAAKEYDELKRRYDYLASQVADMEAARASLTHIVHIIDNRMKDDFVRTFDQVNRNFSETFALLFPGGTAKLVLDDPDDLENTGVEVTAQPRGKRITKMSLMSGGEKSLTAIALLFAIYKVRSTPFYILDEVEAALDDTNLRRLAAYIDSLRQSTQLIMITHQRRTM